MLGTNGGLIGTYRTPGFTAATGIWTPQEQCVAQLRKIWKAASQPVYSQSSLEPAAGALPASLALMTNGSYTDAGAATQASTLEWVKIDYGQLVRMSAAVIGTATSNIPGGWSKAYTENRDVEVSTNDSTWTKVFNTGTFAAEGIYTFYFAPVDARYIRIKSGTYLAISEFYAL